MSAQNILLQGEPASPGKATGKARLIFAVSDMDKMQVGDILVAPMTNPQLTAAILKASAIVTEIGGVLSHAAIVSREFGIPCVVFAKGATEILKDGMEVTVDGDNGLVLQESG